VQQNHDAGNIGTRRDNFLDNSQNILTFIRVVSAQGLVYSSNYLVWEDVTSSHTVIQNACLNPLKQQNAPEGLIMT
jgi:hypothetical protein